MCEAFPNIFGLDAVAAMEIHSLQGFQQALSNYNTPRCGSNIPRGICQYSPFLSLLYLGVPLSPIQDVAYTTDIKIRVIVNGTTILQHSVLISFHIRHNSGLKKDPTLPS